MSDAENREHERRAQSDALAMGHWTNMMRRLGTGGPPLVPVVVRQDAVLRDFTLAREVQGFLVSCDPTHAHVVLGEDVTGHHRRGEVMTVNLRYVRVPEWFLDGGSP